MSKTSGGQEDHDPAGVSVGFTSKNALDKFHSALASMPSGLPKAMRSKLPNVELSSVLCRNESKSKFSKTSGPPTAKSKLKSLSCPRSTKGVEDASKGPAGCVACGAFWGCAFPGPFLPCRFCGGCGVMGVDGCGVAGGSLLSEAGVAAAAPPFLAAAFFLVPPSFLPFCAGFGTCDGVGGAAG